MFILVIAIAFFVIYFIEKQSIKTSLDGIKYYQNVSLSVVEPNEEFEIISTIQNCSKRFVNYLRLREKFSGEIVLKTNAAHTVYKNVFLETTHYLMPLQKLDRHIRAYIEKRGVYFLYGATVYGGDFLGISENTEEFNETEEIVVMPTKTDIKDFELMLSGLIGDMSAKRFIFEDPVLTLGFGDYTYSEPMKRISWTQSLRMGHLMVKKYDYTLELTVRVVLNMDFSGDEEDYEKCLSIARTVFEYLELNDVKYSFITNAVILGNHDAIWRNQNSGSGSYFLMSILESLGRASTFSYETLDEILDNIYKNYKHGDGYVIISSGKGDDMEKLYEAKSKLEKLTGVGVCILTSEIGG